MEKYIRIISVSVSGIGIYLFDKISGSHIDWEKFRELKIGNLLSKQFSLLNIIIFLGLSILIYFILKRFIKKDTIYNKKQRQLRKFDKMEENQNGLLFRWGVYFDFSSKPFISDLETFCTKHGTPPIRFVGNRCPIPNCTNNRQAITSQYMQNYIESDLIDKWEKIK
jgi:hypothetical protein